MEYIQNDNRGLAEKLIFFQNNAELDFQKKKSVLNGFKYGIAFLCFFGSSIIAGITLPVRVLIKAIYRKKTKSPVQKMNAKNAEKILAKEKIVLLDFWAEWCGPCMMMNNIVEDFACTSTDVCVAKVNADTNRALLERYKIKGLPQFVLVKNGKEVKRHAGPMTKNDLHAFCFSDDKKACIEKLEPSEVRAW